MTTYDLEFLKSVVRYINERLYRLEIELQPDSAQRETVMGLRTLANVVTVLLDD